MQHLQIKDYTIDFLHILYKINSLSMYHVTRDQVLLNLIVYNKTH